MNNQSATTVHTQEALLTLYQETWAEISRLRDYEWKIGYYFIALSSGLIALIASDTLQPFITCRIKTVLTCVQLTQAVLGVLYLETTHRHLTLQRNIRRSIEEALGFYDADAYTAESLLPVEWKGKRITSSFQRLGLLVPIMTMALIVQGFSIYLIWKI